MSERRTGILIGVLSTIGAEVVVAIALFITAISYINSGKPQEMLAAMQEIQVPRSEVLALYGDKDSIPFQSFQMFLATKMGELKKK